jgi:hypothetical protein
MSEDCIILLLGNIRDTKKQCVKYNEKSLGLSGPAIPLFDHSSET